MPAGLTRTETDNPNRLAAFLKTVFRKPRRAATPARTSRLSLTHLEDRVTPATLHWTGAASTAWSNPANWVENVNPANGDRLVFDTTTPGFVSFAPNNDIAGLTGLTIGINDSSSGGDFTIGGSAFGLRTSAGVAITSTVTVGTSALVNNSITLTANTTASVGHGTLNLAGGIAGGFSLTSASAPSATLRLDAANTYSGGTVVSSGTVSVNTNTSLGTGLLTLAGGSLTSAQSFLQLPNPFTVTAPSSITGGGFFQLNGDGVLQSTLSCLHTGFVTLAGALSGPGGLHTFLPTGSFTLTGNAPNTFTGGTVIGSGGVRLQKAAGVQALASPVAVFSGSLTINQNNQLQGTPVFLAPAGTLATNGFSDTSAGVTGHGTLNTGGVAASGLTFTGGGNQLFTGTVSGSGFLTYSGPGTFTLSGANPTYTGTLTAGSGTVAVTGDFTGAPVTVTGGTLAGTGLVRSITATSGFVDASQVPDTIGTLTVAPAAAASSLNGAAIRFDLTPQGTSDLVTLGAGATINLNGATLVTNPVGGPLANSYTIIHSPTGGISGTFVGRPNGSIFSIGGQNYQINYAPFGVILLRSPIGPPSVFHWLGVAGSNWGNPANWGENAAPTSGATLIFDTGAPGFAGTGAAFAPNNDIAGLTNLMININDGSTAGNFVIGGNTFGLSGGGTRVTSTVSA
ncbi:MAG TPA: autotransporter-associated beta strand repeat-containing protein, partial [Gemmataceae bacterium]|nr:autotransporter-associated beta strand repeat-containing protein [Gemmataceae bacterium]